MRFLIRDVFGKNWDTRDSFIRTIWKREWKRHFADANFDAVVHFSGYERGVSLLLSGCDSRKVMFVHNEMAKEVNTGRITDGRALQVAYEVAEAVATVREGVEEVYCKQYFDFSHKMIYVPNTISVDCREQSKKPLSDALRDGVESNSFLGVRKALELEDQFRFINLARFSPEKGQIKLIDAFERVWFGNHAVQLFIVGAHGVSFEKVSRHAQASAAKNSIFVLLGSGNPFPLVSRMNAFVLSSNYEGKPIVLYEAFALGLPVVSTDISGPDEVLGEDYGLLVHNSVEGLVEGMQAAIRGDVAQRPYDFETHNQFALDRFYQAVDA
jgi:CDP-glycerol glycerophosphotransferase